MELSRAPISDVMATFEANDGTVLAEYRVPVQPHAEARADDAAV